MKSLPHLRRILCVWFPDWPVQRLLAVRPELERCLVLLTEATNRGEFVRAGNHTARRRGVYEGMPVCEARTFARPRDHLVEEPLQPQHDRAALIALALQCERYSYCIGLEEGDRPECLLMDVTGLAPLFSGEATLARELEAALSQRRLDGRIAIAATIGAAWAAAHFLPQPHAPVVVESEDWNTVESLPVAGLRLGVTIRLRLSRLGIATIRQLLALDRSALLSRFGGEVLRRIDQLTGRRQELVTACRPTPQYRVSKRLEEGIQHPEAIAALYSQLLGELLEQLHPRRFGVRRLQCLLQLEDRSSPTLELRLCEVTADLPHLLELLRLHWERLRLTAPLCGLQLEAVEVAPLEAVQQEFFDGQTRDHARQFSMLLNRLGGRLGEQAVAAPRLLPTPVPEQAVQLRPLSEGRDAEASVESRAFRVLDRPTVLFRQPRPVEVIALQPDGPPATVFWQEQRFDIARHWGPERIETGWWRGEFVRRDYYRVETVAGQWLWVFRRLPDESWFWQGEL
jgi:protein ImuB